MPLSNERISALLRLDELPYWVKLYELDGNRVFNVKDSNEFVFYITARISINGRVLYKNCVISRLVLNEASFPADVLRAALHQAIKELRLFIFNETGIRFDDDLMFYGEKNEINS